MKEFIIKDDPIQVYNNEKGIEKDFHFVTNDDKSTVEVSPPSNVHF